MSFFFFNDTATTEIYTLSLHDALPIFVLVRGEYEEAVRLVDAVRRQTGEERTEGLVVGVKLGYVVGLAWADRKSTRLNSSHLVISYAVFCLKKKIINTYTLP